MLSWLADEAEIKAATQQKKLLDEDCLECRPEKIPSACLDENVDIHLIRPFLTQDAWKLLIQTIEVKKSTHVWICGMCQQDIEEADSIECDLCLEWYHSKCTSLKKLPKMKYWFCRTCYIVKD